MFSMSRSTKNFPQLKMCDKCVKSYSSWNAFFCWLTAFGYSNNQREATLLQNVKLNFENHWHIWFFFTAILITYIKGGIPAQIFLEKGSAMMRATFVIFLPKLSSFIDVLYPGEPLVKILLLWNCLAKWTETW